MDKTMTKFLLAAALLTPLTAFSQDAYIRQIITGAEIRAEEYQRLTDEQFKRDAQGQASHALIAAMNMEVSLLKAEQAKLVAALVAAEATAAKRHAELMAAVAAIAPAAGITEQRVRDLIQAAQIRLPTGATP